MFLWDTLLEVRQLHFLRCFDAPETPAAFTWSVAFAIKFRKIFLRRGKPF